jgi:hypothetical protein
VEPLLPVYTADLFAPLHAELIALLRGLGADQWLRPTVAGTWTVRDVAAHLLDGDLRKLAGDRDGHRPTDGPVSSYDDIVALIDHVNATGVACAARLGPRLITDLLDVTGTWVSEFVLTLDPHRPARLAVAWAGEAASENWMDTGREYTERWHHQTQIRDAVGAPGLLARRWAHPVFELAVRAFVRAFAPVAADEGTAVVFEVGGASGGVWSVVRERRAWRGPPARGARMDGSGHSLARAVQRVARRGRARSRACQRRHRHGRATAGGAFCHGGRRAGARHLKVGEWSSRDATCSRGSRSRQQPCG